MVDLDTLKADYLARLAAATDDTAKATIVAEMENALLEAALVAELAAVQFPKRTTLHLRRRVKADSI